MDLIAFAKAENRRPWRISLTIFRTMIIDFFHVYQGLGIFHKEICEHFCTFVMNLVTFTKDGNRRPWRRSLNPILLRVISHLGIKRGRRCPPAVSGPPAVSLFSVGGPVLSPGRPVWNYWVNQVKHK